MRTCVWFFSYDSNTMDLFDHVTLFRFFFLQTNMKPGSLIYKEM